MTTGWNPVDFGAPLTQKIGIRQERVIVIDGGALTPLSMVADGILFVLLVDGVAHAPQDGSFTISGSVISWNASALSPDNVVVAIYSFLAG